jgi:hypothetical protein
MAPLPNRRELVLDHGRVFIETPQLMTDGELVDVARSVREGRQGASVADGQRGASNFPP